MAKRLSEEVTEHLQCQIHLGTFENPKNLPCQHTFCEKCIDEWIVQKNYILICPYCNKNHGEYLNGAKELTTNYQLMGIIDVMEKDSKRVKNTHQNVTENGVQRTMQRIRNSQVLLQQNCEIAKMELENFRVEYLDILNALCNETTEEINSAFYAKSEKLNRQMSECINFDEQFKYVKKELLITDEIEQFIRKAKEPHIIVESPEVTFEVKRPFDSEIKSAVKLILGPSPDPTFCKIEVAMIENSSIRITIIGKDSKDENVTCVEENVVVKVVRPDKTSDIIRNNSGYLFVPTMFGEYSFRAFINDIELGNSPYKLKHFRKPVMFFLAATILNSVHDFAEFDSEIFLSDKADDCIRVLVFDLNTRLFKRQLVFNYQDMEYICIPYGLAISSTGVLYVTELYNHEVFVSDRYGKLETRFGKTLLKKPTGIALKNDGDILVADREEHCIYLFGNDGRPKAFYGKEGVGIREFKKPWFIAIQKNQSWVVADHDNHRFHIIPLNGIAIYVPVYVCDVKAFVRGVAVDDNDNIIVSVRTLNNLFHILLYNPLGVFQECITEDGKHVNPLGMCVTKINDRQILLVGDNEFGVLKFELDIIGNN